MNDDLLGRLKEAAGKATPGPWTEDDGFIHSEHHPKEFSYIAWTGPYKGTEERLDLMEANAAFIALCSPEVILALVAVVEAARVLRTVLHGNDTFEDRLARLDNALAALDALEGGKR